jgi:DNA repair ATPase RecN
MRENLVMVSHNAILAAAADYHLYVEKGFKSLLATNFTLTI